MNEKPIKTEIKRDGKGWFLEGTAPGPGRPELTEEQRLMKREVKELAKEAVENLAEALPEITPVHIEKALKGDMTAIKEVYDRTMGKSIQPIAADIRVLDLTDVVANELSELNE